MTDMGIHNQARVSNVEQVEQGGQVEPGGGGAEPPTTLMKQQRFKEQVKNDLGWIPQILKAPFESVGKMFKSFGESVRKLEDKPEQKAEIKARLTDLKTGGNAKLREIETMLDQFFESGSGSKMDEKQQESLRTYYEKRLDSPSGVEPWTPPSLKGLRTDKNDEIKNLDDSLDDLKKLDTQITGAKKELSDLNKHTPLKAVGKFLKAALFTIASPVISGATAIALTPFLPIFTGVSLVRAAAFAETGKLWMQPSGTIGADIEKRSLNDVLDDF